ncbi:MAG: rhomboid family intramembrane serine protease [Lewinella sp.]|nr:rhomboid family intramembrane serine protease [Lewinella sp.]
MALSPRLRRALLWPTLAVVLIWLVFLLEYVLGVEWAIYGIAPRRLYALRGIFFTPFLHGDWGHILSNTLPLFSLMALILYFYPRVAVRALLMIYLGTGVTMWLLADPEAMFMPMRASTYHIGASGVIYGMVTFLAWTGIFRRNVRAIAIALVVVFYYGGLVWGVFPGQVGISWEGHLLGALVGVFVAYWFRDRIEEAEARRKPSWEDHPDEERFFLPRDTFDRNKYQR